MYQRPQFDTSLGHAQDGAAALGGSQERIRWSFLQQQIQAERERLSRFPEQIPALISQKLLVSGEDHRHRLHPGFDPIAICRAIWRRLSRSSYEGASTIEQQMVRVFTGRYERTMSRKVTEIVMAIRVASNFPKTELPAIYLANAYYGAHMNGYSEACRRLGIHARALSLQEAAGLVARLKYPQPGILSPNRAQQIERRAAHLEALYEVHSKKGTYNHLQDDRAFSVNSFPVEPIPDR